MRHKPKKTDKEISKHSLLHTCRKRDRKREREKENIRTQRIRHTNIRVKETKKQAKKDLDAQTHKERQGTNKYPLRHTSTEGGTQ